MFEETKKKKEKKEKLGKVDFKAADQKDPINDGIKSDNIKNSDGIYHDADHAYTFYEKKPSSLAMLSKDKEKKVLNPLSEALQINFKSVKDAKLLNLIKRAMIKQQINDKKTIQQFRKQATESFPDSAYQIDELCRRYETGIKRNQIIKQYTAESPLHYIVNTLLRKSQKSTELFLISPFVKDIYLSLRNLFLKQKGKPPKKIAPQTNFFTCFRGTIVDKEELEFYKSNIGETIETLSFISTSINKQGAVRFCQKRESKFPLLIQIEIFYKQISLLSDPGYAYLTDSVFAYEQEVLFNILNKFLITEVTEQELVLLGSKKPQMVPVLKLQLISSLGLRKLNPVKRQSEAAQKRKRQNSVLLEKTKHEKQLGPLIFQKEAVNQGNILPLEPNMKVEAVKYFSFIMNLFENNQNQDKHKSKQLQEAKEKLLKAYFSNMQYKDAEHLLQEQLQRLKGKKFGWKEDQSMSKKAVYFYKKLLHHQSSQKQLDYILNLKKIVRKYIISHKITEEFLQQMFEILENYLGIIINIANCLISLERNKEAYNEICEAEKLIQFDCRIRNYPFADEFNHLKKFLHLNNEQNTEEEFKKKGRKQIDTKELDKLFQTDQIKISEIENQEIILRESNLYKKQQFLAVLLLRKMEICLLTSNFKKLRDAFWELIKLKYQYLSEEIEIRANQIFSESLKDFNEDQVEQIQQEINKKIQIHEKWLREQAYLQQYPPENDKKMKKSKEKRLRNKQLQKQLQEQERLLQGETNRLYKKQQKKKDQILKQMKKQNKGTFDLHKQRLQNVDEMKKFKKDVKKIRKQAKDFEQIKKNIGKNQIKQMGQDSSDSS